MSFCIIGGIVIAQKKRAIDQEITRAEKVIGMMGGKLREVREINLAEFTDQRRLVVIDKLSPSPQQYPRRPGIPAKKPIM